jgi:hypothetical protein
MLVLVQSPAVQQCSCATPPLPVQLRNPGFGSVFALYFVFQKSNAIR